MDNFVGRDVAQRLRSEALMLHRQGVPLLAAHFTGAWVPQYHRSTSERHPLRRSLPGGLAQRTRLRQRLHRWDTLRILCLPSACTSWVFQTALV
jgi:hypothetical protein